MYQVLKNPKRNLLRKSTILNKESNKKGTHYKRWVLIFMHIFNIYVLFFAYLLIMYISGTYPYLSRIFDHELSIIYPESIFPLFCNGFILFTLYCNTVVLFTFYFCLILCNNIGVTFLHKYCFFICTISQPHSNQS